MRHIFHACGLIVYLAMIFFDANEKLTSLAEVLSRIAEILKPFLSLGLVG